MRNEFNELDMTGIAYFGAIIGAFAGHWFSYWFSVFLFAVGLEIMFLIKLLSYKSDKEKNG